MKTWNIYAGGVLVATILADVPDGETAVDIFAAGLHAEEGVFLEVPAPAPAPTGRPRRRPASDYFRPWEVGK